jgi:hypothetical protein
MNTDRQIEDGYTIMNKITIKKKLILEDIFVFVFSFFHFFCFFSKQYDLRVNGRDEGKNRNNFKLVIWYCNGLCYSNGEYHNYGRIGKISELNILQKQPKEKFRKNVINC